LVSGGSWKSRRHKKSAENDLFYCKGRGVLKKRRVPGSLRGKLSLPVKEEVGYKTKKRDSKVDTWAGKKTEKIKGIRHPVDEWPGWGKEKRSN